MDDYTLVKLLGHGSMGTVFLAEFRKTKKLFALKIMSKEALVKDDAIDRAATEREILSKLQSPFLPSLQGHFETDKHQILVLDYCSGGDLNGLRQMQPEKKFSEAAARFYGAEVVLALDHLHKLGFVYRDLKPENVLVHSSGHIMLTDFDLCLKLLREKEETTKTKHWLNPRQCMSMFSCVGMKLNDEDLAGSKHFRSTRCAVESSDKHNLPPSSRARVTPVEDKKAGSTRRYHSFVGTEEYIAPEVLWGTGHDYAVDWWTFGVLLYELLHGTTPFKSFSRKETFFNILCKEPRLSGVSAHLDDLIRRLLVKEPSQRLGYKGGADEIKAHTFFQGIRWDEVGSVCRPPYVPSPIPLDDIVEPMGTGVDLDEHMAAVERVRAAVRSKFRATKPQETSSLADNCPSNLRTTATATSQVRKN